MEGSYKPNQVWEDMDDSELEDWIDCLKDGDYAPLDERKSDEEI